MKEKKELNDALKQFEKIMPPVFSGKRVTELTGGAVNWRTLQNLKSKKQIPPEVFLRNGSRDLLIVRDEFLKYWNQKIKAV